MFVCYVIIVPLHVAEPEEKFMYIFYTDSPDGTLFLNSSK